MKYLIILLLFLSVNVNAECPPFTYVIRDINTKSGVADANFTIDSVLYVSNEFGQITDLLNRTNDTYTITADGYFSTGGLWTTSNETCTYNTYIYPISTNGLVKVMWTDDTFNMPSRKLCYFYQENGRLAGCYARNETFWAINNHAYTVEPETNFYDYFTSTKSLWVNRLNIIPYLGISLFILYLVSITIKRK